MSTCTGTFQNAGRSSRGTGDAASTGPRRCRRVRLVPRLHRVQATVTELDEDRRALGVHRVDHRREPQHLLARVDARHAGRRPPFGEDARRALDDEADTVARVLDEVGRVTVGDVVAVARAFEHRRAVEPVADRRAADCDGSEQRHRTVDHAMLLAHGSGLEPRSHRHEPGLARGHLREPDRRARGRRQHPRRPQGCAEPPVAAG